MVQTSVTAAPTIAFEGMPQTGGNFPNTIASHPASGSIYYGKAVSLYATSEVTLGEQRVKLPTTGSQGRAEKVCSAQTYNLDPAQTVILDVDNVGGATATFDAAAATITDTTSYAVGDQDTKSFTCTITGGEYDGIVQTILFDITVTTALLVAQQINDKLDGGSAGVVPSPGTLLSAEEIDPFGPGMNSWRVLYASEAIDGTPIEGVDCAVIVGQLGCGGKSDLPLEPEILPLEPRL